MWRGGRWTTSKPMQTSDISRENGGRSGEIGRMAHTTRDRGGHMETDCQGHNKMETRQDSDNGESKYAGLIGCAERDRMAQFSFGLVAKEWVILQ